MIRVKQKQNIFFKTITYDKLLTRKRVHFLTFICWFLLILIGTTLIGITTNLYSQTFQFCKKDQKFCSKQFTINQQKQIFIYIILENFHQNNRMFLDQYNSYQLQGNIHNNYHCENYYTYGQLNVSMNAGGYRVASNRHAHPCGQAMTNIFNDSVYLITSQGGAPVLDSNDLVSEYNLKYEFLNLEKYQLKQWIDIQSTKFINYFTVAYTSTKYNLMGKVTLLPDTYQLIIKNNYPTNNVINKKVLITQINGLGITDPIIGFFMFVSGILTLFFHLFLCCRGMK